MPDILDRIAGRTHKYCQYLLLQSLNFVNCVKVYLGEKEADEIFDKIDINKSGWVNYMLLVINVLFDMVLLVT